MDANETRRPPGGKAVMHASAVSVRVCSSPVGQVKARDVKVASVAVGRAREDGVSESIEGARRERGAVPVAVCACQEAQPYERVPCGDAPLGAPAHEAGGAEGRLRVRIIVRRSLALGRALRPKVASVRLEFI